MDYSEYSQQELVEMIKQERADKAELQADFDTVATSIIKLVDNLGVLDDIKNDRDINLMAIVPKVTFGAGKVMKPLENLTPVIRKYELRYSEILNK